MPTQFDKSSTPVDPASQPSWEKTTTSATPIPVATPATPASTLSSKPAVPTATPTVQPAPVVDLVKITIKNSYADDSGTTYRRGEKIEVTPEVARVLVTRADAVDGWVTLTDPPPANPIPVAE